MGCAPSARVSPSIPDGLTFLVVGLDNAGKTTIIKRVGGELDDSTVPTVGAGEVTEGRLSDVAVRLVDVGGAREFRSLWSGYFPSVHGLIIVVDSSARDRLDECAEDVGKIVHDPAMLGKPIVVIANKQDVEGALLPAAVEQGLGLSHLYSSRHRTFGATARKREDPGVERAMTWLVYVGMADIHNLNRRIEGVDAKVEVHHEKECAIAYMLCIRTH